MNARGGSRAYLIGRSLSATTVSVTSASLPLYGADAIRLGAGGGGDDSVSKRLIPR